MTVVVTGAAGHVGGTLVRVLHAQGRTVRALVHRDRRALEGLDIEIVEGDVRDPASLCRAFEGAEAVYHTAARISLLMSDWPLIEAINVTGTRNVVEACASCGVCRLIHFSSIHALTQQPLDIPVDESRPLVESPHDPPYDRSKATGERLVRQAIERGLDAVILYPTGIIGPLDYGPSHMGAVLLALARGQMVGLVPGGFDWVDVRDVAHAALRAEECAPTGARYLLSGHWVSVCELAAHVEEITRVPVSHFVSPMWLARLGAPFSTALARLNGSRPLYTSVSLKALQCNRRVSHARATRDLGYQPRPFQNTLVDTLRWFEKAGQLARPLASHSPETT